MYYQNQPRQVHKAGDEDGCTGNWKCSKCGTAIETLPFQPNPNRLDQLLCYECHKQRKQSFER